VKKNKIRILSTAALDPAINARNGGDNIVIDIVPFINTEPISSVDVQQEISDVLLLQAAVVFTSAKAVEAVSAQLENIQPHWSIFCLGHATKMAVEKEFDPKLIELTADDASKLAAAIVQLGLPEVIFFCGNLRREELPEMLREGGTDVREMTVYETSIVPRRVEGEYDGILFFSPSAVEGFFRLNHVSPKTILFAIGKTTAAALSSRVQNKIILADEPDKEGLVEEAIRFFEEYFSQRD
jgi:uroporphyrinogen-III synthase